MGSGLDVCRRIGCLFTAPGREAVLRTLEEDLPAVGEVVLVANTLRAFGATFDLLFRVREVGSTRSVGLDALYLRPQLRLWTAIPARAARAKGTLIFHTSMRERLEQMPGFAERAPNREYADFGPFTHLDVDRGPLHQARPRDLSIQFAFDPGLLVRAGVPTTSDVRFAP